MEEYTMSMSDFATYINKLSEPERAEFDRIRTIVKDIAPDAEETFSYMMPAFKYKGKPLLYIGAFKNHMSLFPTSGPIAELEDKLKDYTTAKGTLQFTIDNPIPEDVIKDILLVRITQIETR
jgi:uncharacterized protein YdhG (YjbR/CyaY superfamily)